MEPRSAVILSEEQCGLGHSFIDPHVAHNVASDAVRLKILDPLGSLVIGQPESSSPNEIIVVSRLDLELNGGVTPGKRNDATRPDLTDGLWRGRTNE